MDRLLRAMGIAAIALLAIALIPVTIFMVAGMLMYLGMSITPAILIGAVVVLFILITIDVFHLQDN